MRLTGFFCAVLAAAPLGAHAEGIAQPWAFHGQATVIEQYHPAFTSPYRGPNSQDPGSRGDETVTLTGYAGARLWKGGEAWADLEMDQGFGLSNTLGLAAFPNGEGSKVGQTNPYLRLDRLFLRQSFDLGGDRGALENEANQLGGDRTASNLILTLGKFSAADIFDTNDYAHDAANDFMNWAIIDAGPWDYAADAWGYSYGAAAEWSFAATTLRGGLFDLSRMPNGTALTRGLGQYQLDGEAEERFTLWGRDGKAKLLGFASRARIGTYNDALALAARSHALPDTALVRQGTWKTGLSANLQQAMGADWGLFARAALDDGAKETEEFTDMNNSLSVGAAIGGASWSRPDDTWGIALESGGISNSARKYFAAGGLGLLIGDGRLPHYGRETVVETYYSLSLGNAFYATADYQFFANPAYNPDRGPVSVLGLRLHADT